MGYSPIVAEDWIEKALAELDAMDQQRVLGLLTSGPELRQVNVRTIARETRLQVPDVERALQKLLADGKVERVGIDPELWRAR